MTDFASQSTLPLPFICFGVLVRKRQARIEANCMSKPPTACTHCPCEPPTHPPNHQRFPLIPLIPLCAQHSRRASGRDGAPPGSTAASPSQRGWRTPRSGCSPHCRPPPQATFAVCCHPPGFLDRGDQQYVCFCSVVGQIQNRTNMYLIFNLI